MKQVVVRPAAAADIEDAYHWYDSQRPGLGEEFLAALRLTRDRVLEQRLSGKARQERGRAAKRR